MHDSSHLVAPGSERQQCSIMTPGLRLAAHSSLPSWSLNTVFIISSGQHFNRRAELSGGPGQLVWWWWGRHWGWWRVGEVTSVIHWLRLIHWLHAVGCLWLRICVGGIGGWSSGGWIERIGWIWWILVVTRIVVRVSIGCCWLLILGIRWSVVGRINIIVTGLEAECWIAAGEGG